MTWKEKKTMSLCPGQTSIMDPGGGAGGRRWPVVKVVVPALRAGGGGRDMAREEVRLVVMAWEAASSLSSGL